MSERLRTGTHTVARGDRVVLRHTDIRSETGGEAEVDRFSTECSEKSYAHLFDFAKIW